MVYRKLGIVTAMILGLVASAQLRAADKATVTKATSTRQGNNTYTIACDGEFPKLAGSPVGLSTEVDVQWIDKTTLVRVQGEPQLGGGPATNGDPKGSCSGNKPGASCSTANVKIQVRIRIKGYFPGNNTVQRLTDWSDWVDAP